MPTLRLKIPPLLLVAITAAVMWLLARAAPSLDITLPARRPLAVSLAAAGFLVCALGIASFRRARTTVNPMNPASASSLVTTGVYRFTRNPMYAGFLLALVAFAILLANPLAFLGPPAFAFYMTRFQIHPEEDALTARFGPEYTTYQSRVRRWI